MTALNTRLRLMVASENKWFHDNGVSKRVIGVTFNRDTEEIYALTLEEHCWQERK